MPETSGTDHGFPPKQKPENRGPLFAAETVRTLPQRYEIEAVAMRPLFTALFWVVCGSAFAAPSLALLESCAAGYAVGATQIVEIPFSEINETDDYAQGYTADYVTYKGKDVGTARKGDSQAVVFDGKVYVTADATLVNLAGTDFAELVSHSGVDLYQPVDWYSAKDKGNHRYVCVVLNRSMERATPVVFALPTSGKPRQLFFYVGHSR